MEDEIWKHIKGYEGFYMINNLGVIMNTNGKVLKQSISTDGYYVLGLCKFGKRTNFRVHVLMAINFLSHIPTKNIVVDHKDNNPLNNHLSNLQVITTRENTSKDRFRKKYTSKYLGVYWHKHAKKWCASFGVGKKTINLGYYHNEIDAHNAYLDKLKEIENKNI
jgi:hypothetical protein